MEEAAHLRRIAVDLDVVRPVDRGLPGALQPQVRQAVLVNQSRGARHHQASPTTQSDCANTVRRGRLFQHRPVGTYARGVLANIDGYGNPTINMQQSVF